MTTQTFQGIHDRPARSIDWRNSRRYAIGIVLGAALLAFEIFNFDTTNYALGNLLGTISFAGLKWSAVLAFAFCAIDFAGLARIFTPEKQMENEPKEVWYLMGAWLLGATMNAVMTWWAVSLTLLTHDFGNEVLSREVLLRYVPIFVAVLVWLTRILFIGALSVAGESLFASDEANDSANAYEREQRTAQPQPRMMAQPRQRIAPASQPRQPVRRTPKPIGVPQAPRPIAASPPPRQPRPMQAQSRQ